MANVYGDGIIKYAYKVDNPLDNTISVDNNWLERAYYLIKLNGSQQSEKFIIKKSEYLVKFKLDHLPLECVFKALKNSLEEIFFIVKHNLQDRVHPERVRVVIIAPSLREPINLPTCTFDDICI